MGECDAAGRAEGAAAERARICAWLRRVDWNNLQEGEDPFEGDHGDLVAVVVEMIENGEHATTHAPQPTSPDDPSGK